LRNGFAVTPFSGFLALGKILGRIFGSEKRFWDAHKALFLGDKKLNFRAGVRSGSKKPLTIFCPMKKY
jgi:hypothetical protein